MKPAAQHARKRAKAMFREYKPSDIVPVKMYSTIERDINHVSPSDVSKLVTLKVPELTPPSCRPTVIQAPTMAEAQKLAKQAIAHAERVGLPVYNAEQGKAARRRWSSVGDMG